MRTWPKRYVVQTDKTGCGPACVGVFANKSYQQVTQLMKRLVRQGVFKLYWHDNFLKGNYATSYSEIRTLLDHYKVKHTKKIHKFKGWNKLTRNALVRIRRGSRNFHWVVFIRDRELGPYVWDPGFPGRRNDFGRMKGYDFMYVYPNAQAR